MDSDVFYFDSLVRRMERFLYIYMHGSLFVMAVCVEDI